MIPMENKSRDLELEKQIDAYVKGHLSEQESHQMWVKLIQRPDYIDLLETELAVKKVLDTGALRSDSTGTSAAQKWFAGTGKWIAAAASVIILIVAVNFFRMQAEPDLRELAITDIELSDNLITPEVLRSQKSITGADSLMNMGFKAAISGNTEEAVEIYDRIIQEYDDNARVGEAHLNLGIIRYNEGHFEEAVKNFDDALNRTEDDELVQEKAYWYKGNALINIDESESAREAIYNAYSMDGVYRAPAYRLLRKLDYDLGDIDSERPDQPKQESKE